MKATYAGLALVALAVPAYADVIAGWTFETSGAVLTLNNSPAGPVAIAEEGANAAVSTATGLHASAATDWSSPAGNGSPRSFSSNEWAVGDYWLFRTSTLLFTGISSSAHFTRSGFGPARFSLEFSTDGVSYASLIDEIQVTPIVWSEMTVNPGSIFSPVNLPAAADNQATLFLRLSALDAGASGAGTCRFDNVYIEGTLVPGPGTLTLLGLGGVLAARRRR